jgi:putative membrane protein
MNYAQRVWTRAADDHPPESAAGKHDARDWQERSENQNSNELAAQTIAVWILGRRLTPSELRVAAPAAHFAFGAAVGAFYGALAERTKNERGRYGMELGSALWLSADEVAMPLLGLSEPTTKRPLEMHLQSFAAHMVYGAVTELVRRPLRSRL